MTEILGLIPARGGSKSIPRTNIRDFAGYPLIAYSIAAGLASDKISRLVVSTDDEEIAAVARKTGLAYSLDLFADEVDIFGEYDD